MIKKEQILLLKDFLETRRGGRSGSFEQNEALENAMDESIGRSSLLQLDNLWYRMFKEIPIIEEEKHLFRFTRIPQPENNSWEGKKCPIMHDIANNCLTLSSPIGFNDPMDPLIKAWAERRQRLSGNKPEKTLYDQIIKTLDKTRIGCLVDPLRDKAFKKGKQPRIEDCNPLMWAHYADKHMGICIQYKLKPSNLMDTDDTVVRLLNVNYDKPFPFDGNISFVDSLVAKGNFWRYENETRLIMCTKKEVGYYYPMENVEVEAVYMGCRIDDEKRDYLISML